MKRQKHVLTLVLLAAAIAAAAILGGCKLGLLNIGLGDKVDILPPGISIVPLNGVQNGAYIHGTVTVNGEVTDDVGVESVTWMFADEATGDPSPTGTATLDAEVKNWSFVLDTTQPGALWADGEKSFTITVTDGAGKSTETRMLLIFDNTAPTATFINPANGASVYNQVVLRGANSDNTSLIKVQVRIGKTTAIDADDGFVDIVGSKYDWTRSFLSNDFANTDYADDNGDGTWTLPIYLRVYDYAGNVSTNEPSNPAEALYPADLVTGYGTAVDFTKIPSFNLIIDLDRDKPTASIQTPRDATNVAGTVVASGTCFDENPGMKKVQIRIMALENDDTAIGYVTPDGAAIADPGWVDTTLSGGAYWSINLNENENLYDVIAVGGAYEGDPFVHDGRLRVEIRPVDLNDKIGSTQGVTFRLDQSIPRLENPLIEVNGVDQPAWDYLYVRGDIALKATASDDVSVESIKLSLDGGSSYGPELVVVPGTPIALNKAIDTLTDPQIPLAIRTAKSGLLGMVVKVQDNATPAPYVNTWFVTLNLDNLYPTGSYTGTALNGHDPMDLHGDVGDSTSQVMGTSTDGGTVGGIDRVEVYLVKGTNVIDLTDGSLVPKESAPFGESQTSEDYTTVSACKRVIDWTKVGAVDNMQLSQDGSDVDWWAKLDTDAHNFPDGDVEIHFVTWDKAGNAVHGQQAGYIANNAPVIDSITLGTDVNGDGFVGNVASGESEVFTSGYGATGFTVRNGKLTITIAASSGNGTRRYSVKYAGTTEKNTTLTNNVVTITDFTGMPDGAVDGSTFDVLVFDSTVSNDNNPAGELSDAVTIGMTFDNIDGTAPQVWLREFSNTAGDHAKTNYSVWEEVLSPENTTLKAGHLELLGDTLYDNGPFNPGDPGNTGAEMSDDDPDVSGKIVLRGVAWDNQRLGSVIIDIDKNGNGTFGAGESTQILQPGAGNLLVGMNGGQIKQNATGDDLQSFDLETGHQVEWYWVWDTGTIDAKALANVRVRVRAIDASANPNADRAYAYTTSPVAAAAAVSTVLKDVRYVIVSGGSTNFASLGAPDSLAGTTFMATRNGTGSDGTGTVYREDTLMYNLMTVDVVPYVRRLITPLSSAYTAKPSVFDRTAQGRYPVAENATIHVYGFNFDGASTSVAVNGTGLAAPLVPDGMPTLHISVNTGTAALSGLLSLTVGVVPALNNTNNNARASNQEPNGVNNDLLTDDRIIDLWKFNNVETNSAVKYPMMRISPTQQVGFSYGDIESDFIIRINGTRTVYEVSPSKYAYNAIAFDQATTPNFYALALDTDRTNDGFGGSPRTPANSCTKMNFFSRQLGSGNAYPGSYQPGTYKRQLEANWNGYQYNSLRSIYPDLVATSPAAPTDGTPTKIYMVYYDQILEQTKFRYGTVGTDGNTMDYGLALNLDPTIPTAVPKIGTAGGSNEGTAIAPLALAHSVYRTGSVTNGGNAYYVVAVEPRNTYTFVLDALSANADLYLFSDAGYTTQVASSILGGAATDFVDYLTPAGMTTLYVKVTGLAATPYRLSYNDRGTAGNYQIVAGPSTSTNGGQYAGIGVTSTGVAVVAWYDKPNTRLMYSYNTDPSSSGGSSESQWQANAVPLDSDFSGWFVDVAVDGADAIHIAYYNSSNGDLRYIYIPSYNGTPSAPKTIDSFLSTGSNITIMTKLVGGNHVPYISYYMGALTATRNSLRMAYRTNFTILNDGAGQNDSKYTGDWEITSIPTSNIPKDHTVSIGFKDLGAKPLQPIAGYATEVNLETAQLK